MDSSCHWCSLPGHDGAGDSFKGDEGWQEEWRKWLDGKLEAQRQEREADAAKRREKEAANQQRRQNQQQQKKQRRQQQQELAVTAAAAGAQAA
jgi:hypothetical protein